MATASLDLRGEAGKEEEGEKTARGLAVLSSTDEWPFLRL